MKDMNITAFALAKVITTSPVWETIKEFFKPCNGEDSYLTPACLIEQSQFGIKIDLEFALSKDEKRFNFNLIKKMSIIRKNRETLSYNLNRAHGRNKKIPQDILIIIEKMPFEFNASILSSSS